MGEINVLRGCQHPNIVTFKGSFKGDNEIWIAMELCEGGSVLDVMKILKAPLTEKQCQCVLLHCLRGLVYLHSESVIHRDIKAANVLITNDGVVKLADFGV